jgi:hypothetical protein
MPNAPETLVVEHGVPNVPEPQAPPRWQLSAKHEVPHTALMRGSNDLCGQFFLSLAVGFNDLKGLVMFEQYLLAMGRPTTTEATPHFGQWHGVNTQLQRWIGGVLHEIMNVIGAQRFSTVRNGTTLQQLVNALPKNNRAAWDTLRGVATNSATHTSMTKLLSSIRNQTAFHYGYKTTELSQGFLAYFGPLAQQAPNAVNSAAMCSLGVDMDGTRFYYADAAAQQAMTAALTRAGFKIEDVFNIARDVNDALAVLIGGFVRLRTEGTV